MFKLFYDLNKIHLFIITAFCLSLMSCDQRGAVTLTNYSQQSAPVVYGTPTSNWPAVGALVVDSGGDWGAFCTGTLITSQWILTAAHCVDELVSDIPIASISFYVGTNANNPDYGEHYEAYQKFIHPNWNYSSSLANDIALILLQSSVPNSVAAPIDMNTQSLSSGMDLTFVGYGINNAINESGAGLKRYGTSTIDTVYSTSFEYAPGVNNALTCRGDSGGPNFIGTSGSEKISGITSAGDQDCKYFTECTRVDAFSDWINTTISQNTPISCDLLGKDCGSKACFFTGADEEYFCFASKNISVGSGCSTIAATQQCKDGAYCADLYEGEICYAFCRELADCPDGKKCGKVFENIPDLGLCLTSCAITGGDCTQGTACFPKYEGANICRQSTGGELDDTCDPNPTNVNAALPCTDGLLCVQTDDSEPHVGTCKQLCETSSDCFSGQTCNIPVFPNISDIGFCLGQACSPGSFGCIGPCTCDKTTGCDEDCSCDPDCDDNKQLCSSLHLGAESWLLPICILFWRRRLRA